VIASASGNARCYAQEACTRRLSGPDLPKAMRKLECVSGAGKGLLTIYSLLILVGTTKKSAKSLILLRGWQECFLAAEAAESCIRDFCWLSEPAAKPAA
jgi:hypothetical protein